MSLFPLPPSVPSQSFQNIYIFFQHQKYYKYYYITERPLPTRFSKEAVLDATTSFDWNGQFNSNYGT